MIAVKDSLIELQAVFGSILIHLLLLNDAAGGIKKRVAHNTFRLITVMVERQLGGARHGVAVQVETAEGLHHHALIETGDTQQASLGHLRLWLLNRWSGRIVSGRYTSLLRAVAAE